MNRSHRPQVIVVESERMNVLGLMLASLFARRLAQPDAQRHAAALRGDVAIEASGMRVALRCEPGRIEISRHRPAHPRARIHGTLAALLAAALDRDRVRAVIKGELRARGNPLTLWHLLALARADR